ncbi:SH3 domain-containing protein [Shewanella sp. 10N.286.48.A6]|uniref:SH3 domain-containing protein n=1 Tax=Shewanella sp. 10N.286.48.A6 TaxID=1880833 RepID=UPI000C8368FE|nr:SH3 domain-containing protein [Shewanella sp. 10N.286.48.A6]PMH96293.1 hypothetical protein BCU55_19400 [Shewanella sp. 10N.286.48.A6]
MKCLLFILLLISYQGHSKDMIVPSDRVKSSVVLRAEPSSNSSMLGRLFPVEVAILLYAVPYYYNVKLADGQEGYVSKAWTNLQSNSSAELALTFLDVGQGDATLINCPNNNNVLIDMGTSRLPKSKTITDIQAAFKSSLNNNFTLQSFIITHPDKDHYVLSDDIIGDIPIENVFYVGEVADYDADSINSSGSEFRHWFSQLDANLIKPTSDY